MKCIFNRDFKYVPSLETDLRKTFARIRRQQSKKQARNAPSAPEDGENLANLTAPMKATQRT
jgi:hypothetical protein